MRLKNQNQRDEGVPKVTQQPPGGQAGPGGREARAHFPTKPPLLTEPATHTCYCGTGTTHLPPYEQNHGMG